MDTTADAASCSLPEPGTLSQTDCLSLLERLATDPAADVRAAAVQGLVALTLPAAADRVEALATDPAPDVREAVARWVGFFEGDLPDRAARVLAVLERLAADGEVVVRAAAAVTLGELDDAAGLPALRALAADRRAPVRAGAAEGLGGIAESGSPDDPAPAEVGARLLALAADRRAAVRAAAAGALGYLHGSPALERLLALAADADPEVRAAAAAGLGSRAGPCFDGAEEGPLLLEALEHLGGDDDARVRAATADAAGWLGRPGKT